MVDLEAGPKGPGTPIILSKKGKKSQKEEKPTGQAKNTLGTPPPPLFLIAQVLDPPLLAVGGGGTPSIKWTIWKRST